MPDLGFSLSGAQSTSYITPRIGALPGSAVSGPLTEDSEMNQARRQAATENLFATQYGERGDESTAGRVAKYVGAAGIDIGDMVVGSLGGDRGAVWSAARGAGLDGLADFAARNKSGVELTSGLVASVVTAGVADAYIVPMMATRLAASTALTGTRLWQWGETTLGSAKQVAINSSVAAAINGEVATVLGTAGGRALLGQKVAAGIGRAAVQEAAVAAVTRSNQEMWSDDASTNLMLAGLGIGIGGALGAIGARYEMRQIANSDEIMRVRTEASDGFGYTSLRNVQPTEAELRAFPAGAEFKDSVDYTSLMTTARAKPGTITSPERNALVEAESEQAEAQAQKVLQKITNRGIEGASDTRFSLNDPTKIGEAKHLTSAGHEDPTFLLGIDSLGAGPIGKNFDERAEHIVNLKDVKGKKPQQIAEDAKEARRLEKQEGLGLVDGSWMPDSKDLRSISDYVPGQVKLTPTTKSGGQFEFTLDSQSGKKLTVNEGGDLKGFDNLELVDQLKVYEGLNHVTQRMIKAKQSYVLPKNPTWLQMDFARNFERHQGALDFSQSSIKSLDELHAASMMKKADIALNRMKANGGKLDFWDRAKLNLALPSSLERIHAGNGDIMKDVLVAAKNNLKMTILEAKQSRKQLLEANDLREGIKTTDPEIHGDMFNFGRNKETGEWKPVVTGFASYDKYDPLIVGTREQLVKATAENKAYRYQSLQKGNFTKVLTDKMMAAPEFQESMRILGLSRDQITGAGGALDQGLGTALTKSMRYRDSSVMKAAQVIREAIDRQTEEYTNGFLKNVFGGVQNRLASIPARGSKALVDQWFSFAGGWDLKQGVIPDGTGHYMFELADTARNQARRPQSQYLTSPTTGRPVVLDSDGLEYVERFQIGAKQILKDTNAVRVSRGLSVMEEREWYVPPPNMKGKIIGFTIDREGKTVPGGAIVASSQEEFDQLRRAKMHELEIAGNGHRFFSKTEREAIDDMFDLSEMGFVDPGFIGAKKAGQTGSIFGDKINARAMEDSLEWVTDKIRSVTNGTVRSAYDQQIAIARARSVAETAVAGADRRTIYDEWEATILGRPLSSVKPGKGTEVIKATEGVIQSVINSGWPLVRAVGANQVTTWVGDLSHRLGMSRVGSFKTFDELAAQLGPHTPYATAMEFAQANLKVNVPPELRDIAQGINKFSASMLLRWFEIPNAAMNMLGVVTNMPSILRSNQTPLLGTLVGAGGQKVGVVDSYKILAMGFKDMLAGDKHAEWATMLRNGDTTQSVMELNIHMSNMTSKSATMRILTGDKTLDPVTHIPRSLAELKRGVKQKGIDGLISLATDTTESMSRSWSHFIGLRLADMNGIVGTEARHSFARNVANQAIANYNPLNKPELFQSSLGSMFGLFTSYMQQYNQRLFRWMETGDYASMGRQLAMQSTLFGAASVPGYQGLEYFFQAAGMNPNDNPEATLTDAIYAKFGPKVGSVVAHGGIQELPKLLGLPEGIAMYSRGDANFRAPSLDPTKLMAGLNIVAGVANGAWELGEKAISSDSQLTWRGVSETIARNMPNRAMKGTLQVLTQGGQETTADGAVLSDTQNWMETGLRMSGIRSTRQQGEIEAYYANASMRRRLAGRMESLRTSTREILKSGQPYEPMDIFNKYVERGGSPTHFKTWIQDQMKSVSDTRGMRQFVDSLKSPNSQMEAWRYDVRQ